MYIWVCAGIVIVALLLTWGSLDYSYSFGGAGVNGLCNLMLLLVGAGASALFAWRRSSTARAFAVFAFGAVGLSWGISVPLSRWQMAESKITGDRVVDALVSYHAREGHLPERLSDLEPVYLERVPDTALGLVQPVPFVYAPDARDGFHLSFPAPRWLTCSRSLSQDWRCND